MNKVLTKLGMGAVLAATVMTAAVPAEAQRFGHGGYGGYHGGYGRGGIGAGGAAVLGGIVGLGVGAAIASNHGYGGYYGPRGYYAPRGYYGGVYGYPVYGYYDGPRCFTQFRRDYYGYRIPVRVCE